MDPGAWGVAGSYRDASERRRVIGPRAQRAVLEAMGIEPGMTPTIDAPVRVASPGEALVARGELRLEDGTGLGRVDALPPDLPYGYHTLDEQLLLVAPPRCHLPRDLRAWGWTVQLYAARSAGSWGHGDLADLRLLGETARAQGAGFLLGSPIWAPNPGAVEPEPSPYFPSSRRFVSPLYLRVEEVPGAEALGTDLVRLSAAGRALNGSPRIDRAAVSELKGRALAALWEATDHPGIPEAFRASQGAGLRRWAIFATISEELGPDWRRWPEPYRDPGSAEVARFAAGHAGRVAFHEWIQWALDRQRERAGAAVSVITDLPVGADPSGFDAWEWQSLLARDVSIGVPPDRFNTAGQEWGLPAFVPHRLREAQYQPFIETLRAGLRHAGGLRIDHVLGLFRQWWVPAGVAPTEGAYVRFPAHELLAICAIESARAQALIIGEDLGTVPRGVRSRLARANVLSTRLLYFERRPPSAYPRASMAAISTHDLPTMVGTWTGSDLADQAAAGLAPDAADLALLRSRLADATGASPTAEPSEVVLAAHRALAASPSALVGANLEDAMLVDARPNIPGTVPPARANWSVALPSPIESLRSDPFVASLARSLRR